MPYITIKQNPKTRQITLDEILAGEVKVWDYASPRAVTGTLTYFSEAVSQRLLQRIRPLSIMEGLKAFNEKYRSLFDADRASLYKTFYIPKRSGGLRRIDAPNDELMGALRELKTFMDHCLAASYHTSAFAYVTGRSTVDAVKRHQANDSRWFLKIDFTNFFGSTTKPFLLSMLSKIFPFSEVVAIEGGNVELSRAIDLCFLNDGLPQGTPISPFLTNLMMIPIDHEISNKLHKNSYVYTRYADDVLISHRYSFKYTEQCDLITDVLKKFEAPFRINHSKTRYGSRAGRNWNLGIMLNKDNNITIGHQKKKQFEAMCTNYILDKKNGVEWDRHDVQVFSGLISYYKMIEKDFVERTIAQYGNKYNVNIEAMIRRDLR